MISKEEIERMYLDEGMTQAEIGKLVGVSQMSVHSWLREYGIPTRNKSESKLIRTKNPGKKELERMYIDEHMSSLEIAGEIDVDPGTVRGWLYKYNIPVRSKSESKLIKTKKPSKKELEKMHIDKQMSACKIASEIGVSHGSVSNWLCEYGIQVRGQSDYYGELNGNWQGGISYLPYCHKFNNKFKESVRKRDDYTCQLCGYEQKLNGRRLSVHHIHYDKENCYPDCVALCASCNSIVNYNRDYYELFFEDQLQQKGHLNWSPEFGE